MTQQTLMTTDEMEKRAVLLTRLMLEAKEECNQLMAMLYTGTHISDDVMISRPGMLPIKLPLWLTHEIIPIAVHHYNELIADYEKGLEGL